MKKIGILFGEETTYPGALLETINSKGKNNVRAEFIVIDKVLRTREPEYAVIIDRVSHKVPFYRSYLKLQALSGTSVLNNPFLLDSDERFFNSNLAERLGIPVPKSVLLPSNQPPDFTNEFSFRNLAFPLDWEKIFDFVGVPAYLKTFTYSGKKIAARIESTDSFFTIYNNSGKNTMMLQEEIEFNEYYKVYCINKKDLLLYRFNPESSEFDFFKKPKGFIQGRNYNKIVDYALRICNEFGYEINSIDFGIRSDVIYAIDASNPVPGISAELLGEEGFEWIVEKIATLAIKKAAGYKYGKMNLSFGDFYGNIINTKSTKLNKPKTK